MKTKTCTKCKEELPITEFYKHKTGKFKVNSVCKKCRVGESKEYYQNHKKESSEYNKKYEQEHRQDCNRRKNKWYHKNKHKLTYFKNTERGIMYTCYYSIIIRCYNPNHQAYRNYGARGIKVCDKWLGKEGFENFIKDMGYKPSRKYQIHRLDNDYNYCKENCEWIIEKEHKKLHGLLRGGLNERKTQ